MLLDEFWEYLRAPNEHALILNVLNTSEVRSLQTKLYTALGCLESLGSIQRAVATAASSVLDAHGRMLGAEHVCPFV